MGHPEKGGKQIHIWLTRDKGHKVVSRNRVERLYYRVMGLRTTMLDRHLQVVKGSQGVPLPASGPDRGAEKPGLGHRYHVYPDEERGMYLVAVTDLYSRYIVNRSLSNTMDAEWCREMVEGAIEMHKKPDMLNTDQGLQFTSELFAGHVLSEFIMSGMDDKGYRQCLHRATVEERQVQEGLPQPTGHWIRTVRNTVWVL